MKIKFSLICMVMFSLLVGCNKSDNAAAEQKGSTTTAVVGGCNFESTKDNSPIIIKAVATDTPEAKQFLTDCINPYTKKYATDAEAAKAGRRVYTLNNCMGCHGGKLEGVMAPALTKAGGQGAYDQKWVYAKNATDKGMFETIAAGTPGTSGGAMFIWHNQLPGKTGEGLSTDEILKVIAYIRTEYKGDGEKTWLN